MPDQGRSKRVDRVDNVQGPRGSGGPNQNEPPKQPLVWGSLIVLLRLSARLICRFAKRFLVSTRLCHHKCTGIEGHILYNNALNILYFRLFDVRPMVKDHSDSERGNPLPPLFGLRSFICTFPQTG